MLYKFFWIRENVGRINKHRLGSVWKIALFSLFVLICQFDADTLPGNSIWNWEWNHFPSRQKAYRVEKIFISWFYFRKTFLLAKFWWKIILSVLKQKLNWFWKLFWFLWRLVDSTFIKHERSKTVKWVFPSGIHNLNKIIWKIGFH